MDYTTYITPIAAFSGVIISLSSILYTKQQNTRRLDVNLKIDDSRFHIYEDPEDLDLELSAFNSGFRSVAVIGYEFYADNKEIVFDINDSYGDHTKKNTTVLIRPKSNDELPYALKEGEITYATIELMQFVHVLKRRKLQGSIEVSGYYETAQNKKYWSKPIEINLDEWR